MHPPSRGKRFRDISLLGITAIAGAAGLIAATAEGIGIYPDSVMYILMARSMQQGLGLTMGGVPVELFPPLYPWILALTGLFGVDPVGGARWIQASVWAVNIFWVGFVSYAFTGKSLPAALLASIVTLCAVDLIAFHAVALSDGAFLFFLLPSILALNRYLAGGKTSYLVVSAVLSAMAALVRYAGLSAIAGGIFSILLLERKPYFRRISHAVVFGVVGFLPPGIWMLRNLQYENAMGRSFDAHSFMGQPEITSLLHTVSAWFFQWKIPDAAWMALLPAALVAFLIVRAKSGGNGHRILLIYMAAYTVLLVLTAAFFQADLFRDSTRLMMPLHVLFVVLAVTTGHEWLKRTGNPAYYAAAIVVSSAIAAFVIATGVNYVKKLSADGQGYAGRAYRTSPLIQRTRSIQSEITVYTNLRLPIVFYTGRLAFLIPLKINNSTQRSNERYDAEMRNMAADIRDSSALLVYFNRTSGWFVQPTLEEISRYVPLRCIAREDDGGVYEAVPGAGGVQ